MIEAGAWIMVVLMTGTVSGGSAVATSTAVFADHPSCEAAAKGVKLMGGDQYVRINALCYPFQAIPTLAAPGEGPPCAMTNGGKCRVDGG